MYWEFLSNPDNQKTLSFIGGGFVVAVSGLWTAFLVLRKKPQEPQPKPKPKPSQSIQSGDGITAIGDVLVEGGVTINKTQFPKSILGLFAIGVVLLATGFLIPRGDCTISSVTAGGDLNAGDITISGGSAPNDC